LILKARSEQTREELQDIFLLEGANIIVRAESILPITTWQLAKTRKFRKLSIHNGPR